MAGCLIRGRRRWSVTYTSPRGLSISKKFRIWNRRAFQERKPYQFPGRMKNSPYYCPGRGANPRPPAHPDFMTSKESHTLLVRPYIPISRYSSKRPSFSMSSKSSSHLVFCVSILWCPIVRHRWINALILLKFKRVHVLVNIYQVENNHFEYVVDNLWQWPFFDNLQITI